MLFDFDYENDILFFHREDNYKYEFSEPLTKNIILDLNKNQHPSGLEILNASKIFKIEKQYLKSLKTGNLHICISEETIGIDLNLSTEIHNKSTELTPVNVSSENYLSIPTITANVSIEST